MATEAMATEVQGTGSVYIYHSRSDTDFVRKLSEALQEFGIRTKLNSEDVDSSVKQDTSDFLGIDEANAFLFVMSPEAVAAEFSTAELDYAFERNKDIIPVLRRTVDSESVPKSLASLQWVFFRDEDDPYEAFQSLVRAIDPDVAKDVDPVSIRTTFRIAGPARSSSVPTHPDRPAEVDQLGHMAFAEALAVRVRGRRQKEKSSFMVHIYGPWGSGKSTLLDFLGKELKRDLEDQPPWLVISFNAWQHQRIGLPWWWLLDSVFRQGVRQLLKIHQCYSANSSQLSRWAIFGLAFRNWLQALWLNVHEFAWRFLKAGRAPYVVALALVFGLIWLAGSFGLFGSDTNQGGNSTWIATVMSVIWRNLEEISGILTVLTVGWALILGVSRSLLPASSQAAETFLQSTRDPMRALKRHFCHLVKRLKYPVAIFIDDLDRCQGDYVVDLLEGIQTLFSEPPVVYVVAADRRWVYSSYEGRYEKFVGQVNEPGRSLGYLFLQKTFQFATPVPVMSPEIKAKYWRYLIGARQSEDQHTLEVRLKAARHEARQMLRSRNTQEEIQEVLSQSDADDPVTQQAYREEAAIRFGTAEVEANTEHVLQDFAGLLESNPRAMKRLVNAYGVNRTIDWLVRSNTDWKQLILYTILELRWPLLAEYLVENPEMVKHMGTDSSRDAAPENLRELFQNQDVLDVIEGKDVGASLDENAIRALAGMLPATSRMKSSVQ